MKNTATPSAQLELTLPKTPIARRSRRAGSHRQKAHWWFARMHQRVDEEAATLTVLQPVLRLG